MRPTEVFVPRLLAAVMLLISVAMLAPLGSTVITLARGGQVVVTAWAVPLAILATGAILTGLLARQQVSLQLFLTAFALWVLTAGYFFIRFVPIR